MRAALAMGMAESNKREKGEVLAESSRGRRERSPKQEYLKQVLVV